jgi:hypothetical protein
MLHMRAAFGLSPLQPTARRVVTVRFSLAPEIVADSGFIRASCVTCEEPGRVRLQKEWWYRSLRAAVVTVLLAVVTCAQGQPAAGILHHYIRKLALHAAGWYLRERDLPEATGAAVAWCTHLPLALRRWRRLINKRNYLASETATISTAKCYLAGASVVIYYRAA